MSAEIVFVDTNVLVNAYDVREPEKRRIAGAFLRQLWHSRTGAISTQVLQEFYVSTTRKLKKPLTGSEARRVVGVYVSWLAQPIDGDDVLGAAELAETEQLSLWDALIVTSAGRAGARTILSEDFGDGRVIGGIRIENPFAA
jgi:predicted nucleic acid-binding protein